MVSCILSLSVYSTPGLRDLHSFPTRRSSDLCKSWRAAWGFPIHVSHFPPGTSKWNKIEHRMFCHITENWRGRPLVSHAVVVNLIGGTRTRTGLRIQAELDTNAYEKGIKVTNQELAEVRLKRDKFHGEWNYTVLPHKK